MNFNNFILLKNFALKFYVHFEWSTLKVSHLTHVPHCQLTLGSFPKALFWLSIILSIHLSIICIIYRLIYFKKLAHVTVAAW